MEEGEPWEEYVHRINMGINDAAARGFPRWYIDKYIRDYIPTGGEKEAVEGFKPEEAICHAVTDMNGQTGGEVDLSALFE